MDFRTARRIVLRTDFQDSLRALEVGFHDTEESDQDDSEDEEEDDDDASADEFELEDDSDRKLEEVLGTIGDILLMPDESDISLWRKGFDSTAKKDCWINKRNKVKVYEEPKTPFEQLTKVISVNLDILPNVIDNFVNIPNSKVTPLRLAVKRGHVKCVKALLNAGADIQERKFRESLQENYNRGKNRLLKKKGPLNRQRRDDQIGFYSILRFAAECNLTFDLRISCFKLLIECGAKINLVDTENWNALCWVQSNDFYKNIADEVEEAQKLQENAVERIEVVQLLLKYDADTNWKKSRYAWQDELDELDQSQPELSERDPLYDHFLSPLFSAVQIRDIRCLKALINKGADISIQLQFPSLLQEPTSTLRFAVLNNFYDGIQLLISHGADVNEIPSVLQLAGESNFNDVWELLFENGAEIVDKFPWNSLAWAVQCEDLDIVKILLANGVAVDPQAFFPLHYAIRAQNIVCMKILLEGGADANRKEDNSMAASPLDLAIDLKNTEMAELLIRHGAKINVEDESKISNFVFILAEIGDILHLRMFLFQKPDLANAADSEGRTVAYRAAFYPTQAGELNPCFDVLIDEYNAVFQTKRAGKLNDFEKKLRALEFCVSSGVLVWFAFSYLIRSDEETGSCDTFYGGMLLQPYLFDILAVFLFKAAQFQFEEVLIPAFELIYFFFKHRKRSSKVVSVPLNQSAKLSEHYPSIKSTFPTSNPLRTEDVEIASRSTINLFPDRPQPKVYLTSRALYALLGEDVVKAWRKQKYRSAVKADPNYFGPDFWKQSPYHFLLLQLTTSIGAFVVALCFINQSLSIWNQYNNFYATIVNSSIPTAVFSILKLKIFDKRGSQMSKFPQWILPLFFFPLLILLPPLFTHIMPAMLMYFWISAPSFWLAFKMFIFWRQIVEEHETSIFSYLGFRQVFIEYHVQFFAEIFLRLLFIFLFHTLFNWSSLIYLQLVTSPLTAYVDVIKQDVHLRSQYVCFERHAIESARGITTLFSWF